ncbi:MAG: Sigma 54-dependent transcriptional activator containing CheY-like receiver domain [Verrucomicrobiaceae bacterium]|nr:Sigma 54-dependent transcriptional activator containing CheY-like receiver domain [Verrucomicrobiaceae bacterium]
MTSLQKILGKARVLVVEDDADLREALTDTLELAGAEVVQADSGEQALAVLPDQYVDMVVSDVNMGGMDGLELLKNLRRHYPQLPVLLITAYGSVAKSVEAMRAGAVDYLVKPFKPQILVETVARYVGAVVVDSDQPVAVEPSSQQLLQLARRVAATDSTVLICGESGTGKEVLARYIHQQSPRIGGPFVAINCAAIPENMLEAILFGHEKGAFTGAHAALPGKFEQANGGTLLLDEISEMDLSLQAKLLRVIQEREVERLGSRTTTKLDIRLLATTNRDLRAEVSAGRFREDLFYRLSVFPLQWLPLRQRRADIAAIASKLLHVHASKMGCGATRFDADAQAALRDYAWPGNVRELDNVVQRALILHHGDVITAADLCLDPYGVGLTMSSTAAASEAIDDRDEHDSNVLGDDLQRREFEIILDMLRDTGGSRKTAAERLGISPRTLRYKLARMRDCGLQFPGMLVEV